MPESGIVIKAYGGFFYIAKGGVAKQYQGTVEAVLPGRLKKKGQKCDSDLPPVVVGDKVDYSCKDFTVVIEKVYPRQTELLRPPIANVDQVVVITSAKTPLPDLLLMDKIIVQAESQVIDVIVVLNKVDAQDAEITNLVAEHYRLTPYPLLMTSAKDKSGLEELSQHLKGRISVLAGASGVGKSSLLKELVPDYDPPTQPVSRKSARGRHTTKHVELLRLSAGGLIADTPGFSNITLEGIELQELSFLFPEFSDLVGECRFRGCLHIPEPGCRVKAGVKEGLISSSRYANYCRMVEEIKSQKKW